MWKLTTQTWLVLARALLHVVFGWVLAKGPQHIAQLRDINLAVAAIVEQVESLLKLCKKQNLEFAYPKKASSHLPAIWSSLKFA